MSPETGDRPMIVWRTLRHLCVGLALAGLLSGVGCSSSQKRAWKYRSAESNFQAALEAEHPDDRRDAVIRIAESGYVDSEDAFAILDAIARTDPVVQIRCVAIRAFTRYEDDRPIAPLLKILRADPGSADALPPNAEIRWETVHSLTALAQAGVLSEQQAALVRAVFIELLENGGAREVRLAAIEGLAEFKHPDVLSPLIRTLRDRDFALADRAERALIALTGTTHYYDADAWESWVAQAEDPFANAGQIPETDAPKGPTWWDRQKRAWRRAIKLPEE